MYPGLIVGTHMTFDRNLSNVIKSSIYVGNNCLQFMLGSNASFERSSITNDDLQSCLKLVRDTNTHVFSHVPNIYNLAGSEKQNRLAWSGNKAHPLDLTIKKGIEHETSILAEINLAGQGGYVVHPGTFSDTNEGLKAIVRTLDRLDLHPNAQILLEISSDSKKGSKLAKDLDQLQYLLYSSRHRDKLKVCIDTCHVFASGEYNLQNDESLKKFYIDMENKLPNKLGLIHFNDSDVPFCSCVDRHCTIGYGHIWGNTNLSGVYSLLDYCKSKRIPIVTETSPTDVETLGLINYNMELCSMKANQGSRERETTERKEQSTNITQRIDKRCNCFTPCCCE